MEHWPEFASIETAELYDQGINCLSLLKAKPQLSNSVLELTTGHPDTV